MQMFKKYIVFVVRLYIMFCCKINVWKKVQFGERRNRPNFDKVNFWVKMIMEIEKSTFYVD